MAPRRRTSLQMVGMALVATAAAALVPVGPGAGAASGDVTPVLVRDVWPGTFGSAPNELTVAGGNLFFSATHPTYGRELWMTTAAGTTRMVRNLVADTGGRAGSSPTHLTAVASRLFFLADDASQDTELYVSDGTAAGTRRVEELNPFGDATVAEMTAVGDTLYFVLTDPHTFAHALWKSDGTAGGTHVVHNFVQVQDPGPEDLVEMGGLLYFSAFRDPVGPAGGRYLYKSDGTAAGTVPVKRVNLVPDDVTAVGDRLYFSALLAGNPSDSELWTSDGTAAGTHLVRNINPTVGQGSDPQQITAVGGDGMLYFTARDSGGDREVYKSDGTTAGTRRVRNIRAAGSSFPGNLTDVNGVLYFTAQNDDFRIELFRSDGTFAGTKQVPPSYAVGSSSPHDLTAFGDLLYYGAKANATQDQLWVTDGTVAGTRAVGQASTSNGASPGDMVAFNGTLYFRDGTEGPDFPQGSELYKLTIEP